MRQFLDEVLESDGFITVMFDGDSVSRGMNRSAFGEQWRAGIQIFHIGQDGTEDQEAVGLVDELLNLFASDESAIYADVEMMILSNDGLSQQSRGDRNIQPFHQTC